MARGPFARYTARRQYAAASEEARQAWVDFTELDGTPLTRCQALSVSADCQRAMAATAFGFRRANERDQDGRTLAESHGLTALLLETVADTELATQQPNTDKPWWRRRSNLADDPTIWSVLTGLSTETRERERADLTLALRDAVIERVGSAAAETLALIACGYYVLSGMPLAEASRLTGPAGKEQNTGDDL